MIYKTGSILEDTADYVVIPVNCVGTMGAGLALAAKKRFPELDAEYQWALRIGALRVRHPYITVKQHTEVPRQRLVLFPTKFHYKDKSDPQDIAIALVSLFDQTAYQLNKTMAFPKLGCGLGGLSWEEEMKPIFETQRLYRPDTRIIVYTHKEK